jgi:hypothetical protein
VGSDALDCPDTWFDCIPVEAVVAFRPAASGPSPGGLPDEPPLHSPPSSPIVQNRSHTLPPKVAREAHIEDGTLVPGSQDTEVIIQGFLAEMCAELVVPTLRHPPPRCRAKACVPLTVNGLPQRSARVVAQGQYRVSNPEVQA